MCKMPLLTAANIFETPSKIFSDVRVVMTTKATPMMTTVSFIMGVSKTLMHLLLNLSLREKFFKQNHVIKSSGSFLCGH